MKFLKQHYEKVMLGAVLAFLVVAVALLPFKISAEQEALERARQEIIHITPKPLTNLDLSVPQAALARAKAPFTLTLSTPPHNLFNPVQWAKTPDGKLVKIAKGAEGPTAVEITKISPLYMIITFDSVGAAGSNYLIKVRKETELTPSKRDVARYVFPGGKTEVFTLRDVKGPLEKPTALELELNDTGERVTIAPDRPYRRVDGYTADLKYEPEKKFWPNRRVGSVISFGGEDYTISSINLVATDQYELLLSAKSSGKKTTLKFNAAP